MYRYSHIAFIFTKTVICTITNTFPERIMLAIQGFTVFLYILITLQPHTG